MSTQIYQLSLVDAINAIHNLNKEVTAHHFHIDQKGNMINLYLNGGLIHGTTDQNCFISYVSGLLVGRMTGLNEAERKAS